MRLIDADNLKKTLRDWVRDHWIDVFAGGWCGSEFNQMIDDEDTVDVAPAVHAHWITTGDTLKKCSNCGYDFMPTSLQHYCPCCGAKMDEETKDETNY